MTDVENYKGPETLTDKYFRLIEFVNNNSLTDKFIFIHNKSYFLVSWYNGKWSDPEMVNLFS